jgi:hypothetical protein
MEKSPMVVLDATFLLLFFQPDAGVPRDSAGQAVAKPRERIEFLISQLEKEKTRIVVPTPALSEVLIGAGAELSQKIIEVLQRKWVFRVEPFDLRAAVEVAAMLRSELQLGKGKSNLTRAQTWAKVKYDRQIMAIAKVSGATTIYSDDQGLRSLGTRLRIDVLGIADLPAPPEDPQANLFHAGDTDLQAESDAG